MANLSNINNKFLFTDGDFLKIGNLAPINNISGTESGISITNGNCASITLDNSASQGKTFSIFSAVNGSLNFYDVDAGSNRLVISTAGDTTVNGNITAVRGFFNSGSTNVVATFTSTDGTASLQCVDNSGNVEFGASGNNFVVQPAGGVAQLTVGASSSTFAGKVTIGNTTSVQPLTVAGNVLFRTTTADGFENRFQFIAGGSGDAGNFYVYNDTETPRVRLNAAGDSYFMGGDLGVGESSPSQKLNVREDGGSDVFRGIEVHNNNTSLARAGIAFQCYDWVQSAIWHGRSTTAAYAGALVLGTNPNTSDLTVSGVTGRMWILNNGDVGIGTNSPERILHLDADQGRPIIQLDKGGQKIISIGTGSSATGVDDTIFQMFNEGSELVRIFTEGNSWFNGGNVGIGTTSPNYSLDVNGIIRSENASEIGILYLGNTAQSEIPGGAIVGQRSSYNSTGKMEFQVPTWGAGTDYGPTTQMTIEVNASDTKEATISMIPFGGKVGIGTSSPESNTLLHLKKNAAANTTVELLRLDCGENSHASSKGGKIVFRDINVYNDTATIEAVRLSASSASTLNFRLRNSANGPILALRSDHIAQFQGTSTSDIIKINSGTELNSNVGMIIFQDNGGTYLGQITGNSATTTTSYLSASDYRLKEDLKDFNGLDLVSNIKVYDFKWKAANERTYGVMAHELNEVIPQAVNGKKDAERMQSADYSKIVPVLVKAIQELKAEIELLKNK